MKYILVTISFIYFQPIEDNDTLWRILAMIISALGLAIVIITFLAELVTLYKAEKPPAKHEVFLPFGLILLYASIAVMAPNSNNVLDSTICGFRRLLPGLGLVSAFVGLILQVCGIFKLLFLTTFRNYYGR